MFTRSTKVETAFLFSHSCTSRLWFRVNLCRVKQLGTFPWCCTVPVFASVAVAFEFAKSFSSFTSFHHLLSPSLPSPTRSTTSPGPSPCCRLPQRASSFVSPPPGLCHQYHCKYNLSARATLSTRSWTMWYAQFIR